VTWTNGPTGDDAIGGPYNIGFTFNFYGTAYTQFTLSTNGVIGLGATVISSDYYNYALPTSTFSTPVICPYWDDLYASTAGQIRYATVGTSPNMTLLIDYNLTTLSGYAIAFQVELHQGSDLITVRYYTCTSASTEGQGATIGIQGPGGTTAPVIPIVYNGTILDVNRLPQSVSFSPIH
jgi:hypothetical protein